MKLENLLKLFAASRADELKIEPDSKPYLVLATGKEEVAETVFTAANVSQLIFPIIPLEEKLRLPNLPQISFKFINELGMFGVTVAKSPGGLNVLIKKVSVPAFELKADFQFENSLSPPPPQPSAAIASTTVSPAVNVAAQMPVGSAVRTPPKIASATAETPANLVEPPSAAAPSPPPVAAPKAGFNPLNSAYLSSPLEPEEVELAVTALDNHQPPPSALPHNSHEPASIAETAVGGGGADILRKFTAQIVIPPTVAPPTVVSDAPTTAASSANSPAVFSPNTVTPQMDALFYQMAERGASDLHLSVSMPPMIRRDGKMSVLEENQIALRPDVMRDLLYSIMPEKNRAEFERRHDTDFAYEIKDLARFRANIFLDRKGMGGVFRIIPSKILTAEQLGLSESILKLCDLSKGLVVVTGPTGSGKSTTLCAMIDYVNRHREDHIITIEDPIEFVHENQKCLLNQREVHNHTDSFKDALRAALREDPDILLVGEMRDLETISIAIETAETGHLVFGTLHTTTAPSTVDRIIDQFPADRQQQIRVMLSESLKGVIAQTLLPKKGGGRIAALEVLIITPAISNLIREGKTFQIASAMQTGKQHGMVMLNDALVELVKKGLVEPRDAYLKAVDKTGIDSLFKRHEISY